MYIESPQKIKLDGPGSRTGSARPLEDVSQPCEKKAQSWKDPEIHFGKGGCLKILEGVFEATMFVYWLNQYIQYIISSLLSIAVFNAFERAKEIETLCHKPGSTCSAPLS